MREQQGELREQQGEQRDEQERKERAIAEILRGGDSEKKET